MIAVGTPFDGSADRPRRRAQRGTRSVGEAIRGRGRLTPSSSSRARSCPAPRATSSRRCSRRRRTARQAPRFGVAREPGVPDRGPGGPGLHAPRPARPRRRATSARRERLDELYAGFPDVPRVHTTVTAAEMIKYASNALLATMISFSNEFADLCSAVGDVDVVDVMRGLHASTYLTVGRGRAPRSRRSSRPAAASAGAACRRT